MRQWLGACIVPYSWISVPLTKEDGSSDFVVFQVLTAERKTMHLKGFQPDNEANPGEALYTITAQPVERWRFGVQSPMQLPTELEVFVYTAPEMVDVLSLYDGGSLRRHEWLVWTPQESDVGDCIALRHPTPMVPKTALDHPAVLVLSLLDALGADDLIGIDEPVWHSSKSAKAYDSRCISSKRAYLQCVVALPELAAAGVSFPPTKPASYYQLLLRTKRPVDASLAAREVRRQLAALDGDTLTLRLLDRQAPPPLAKRGRSCEKCKSNHALVAPARPTDTDSSVIGDPSSSDGDAEPGGGDSVARHRDVEVAGGPAASSSADAAPWPQEVLGCRVRFVKGRRDSHWSYSDRLKVVCPNAEHERCSNSRSVALDTEFGARGVVGFIGAWLARSYDMSAREHRAFVPEAAAIRDHLDQ